MKISLDHIICMALFTKVESSSNLAPCEGRRREHAALTLAGTITLAPAFFMNLTVLLVSAPVCLGALILYCHAFDARYEISGETTHGKPFWKFNLLHYFVQHCQEFGKEMQAIKLLPINVKNLCSRIKFCPILICFLIDGNMNIQFIILEDPCAFSHASD